MEGLLDDRLSPLLALVSPPGFIDRHTVVGNAPAIDDALQRLVVRFAQFVGPPIGSLMADHTGPRSVFAAAPAGIAVLAATWRPLRRSLVLRAKQGQKVVRV